MDAKIADFVDALRVARWSVELSTAHADPLFGAALRERYPRMDPGHLRFLRHVRRCVGPDRVTWFLCADDYMDASGWPIRWNEWELYALEVAVGRPAIIERIERHWRDNLPIVGTVKSEYSYLALRLSGPDRGAVFWSNDPGAEEVERVCGSFDELLELTRRWLAGDTGGAAAAMSRFF